MSLSLAHQLHIPAAIRPGFETEASAAVKRHPHPWPYESDGFSSAQYHHASQYYLDRERKPGFYGYPETPQFQVKRTIIWKLKCNFPLIEHSYAHLYV